LTNEKDSPLKVIDFGLSSTFGNDYFDLKLKEIKEDEELYRDDEDFDGKRLIRMHSKVGTPYYVAPEVIHGEYNE